MQNGVRLNDRQARLWMLVSNWFVHVRPNLGVNHNMQIDNCVGSLHGILFEVSGVENMDAQLLDLFRSFHEECPSMKMRHDDAMRENIYTQIIPYDVLTDFDAPPPPQQIVQEPKKNFWSRFANEPSWIISALIATLASATATTKLASWMSLVRTIGVVVGLV